MREKDAQNKICPINSIGMYIAMSASSTQRRVDALVDNCKCTASDCMMWRANRASLSNITPYSDMEDFKDKAEEIINSVGHGYCGLAGKE